MFGAIVTPERKPTVKIPDYNDSGSGALVDQGVHGDLGDRVEDRENRNVG